MTIEGYNLLMFEHYLSLLKHNVVPFITDPAVKVVAYDVVEGLQDIVNDTKEEQESA